MHETDPHLSRWVRDAFWMLLGRPPNNIERPDLLHEPTAEERRMLLARLLASAEFHLTRATWKAGREIHDALERERGLRDLGNDDAFVRLAYECLLGRAADESGHRHYTAVLRAGDTRLGIVRTLVLSAEFERYFAELAPDNGFIPRDTQLCELANPAKWANEEWLDILRSLGLSDAPRAMHRKPYEFAQLIFGCRRLGVLREDAVVLSVGAGHELVLYWLANHVRRTVATDMYEGVWRDVQSREGDPDVMRRPKAFAPFPYRADRLTFMKMDGRHLAFCDGTFDIAYSLSSIEHIGGLDGARTAIGEMGRVLKPGGVLALSTEYVLEGPPHEETFQPHELAALIDQPGLTLVEPVDEAVYRRYEYAAIDLYKNPYQTPHMVVRFNNTVFTTVMVFLRKV